MHIFTPQQRSRLLANPSIQKITEKFISFSPMFKIKAVKLYLSGMSPKQIFQEENIPIDYFQDDYFRNCIKRWLYKFKNEGEDSLKEDGRTFGAGGPGRPKSENLDVLTYDELLTLVEIQKGVIEDLKKKKALAKKKY